MSRGHRQAGTRAHAGNPHVASAAVSRARVAAGAHVHVRLWAAPRGQTCTPTPHHVVGRVCSEWDGTLRDISFAQNCV